jgi:uncharacterized membrane protein
MNPQSDTHDLTTASWTRVTWLGWLLGIPFTVILALAGEALGIGGSQFLVGAGMGCGVGLMQGRAVMRLGLKAIPWFCSCTAGLAAPFLVSDLGHLLGITWPNSQPVCVAVGGVVAGLWQAVLLRPRFEGAGWWLVGSALGWSLAGVAASLADALPRSHSIRGLAGAGLYLGLVAVGGLILGIVTGVVLVRRLRPRSSGTSA